MSACTIFGWCTSTDDVKAGIVDKNQIRAVNNAAELAKRKSMIINNTKSKHKENLKPEKDLNRRPSCIVASHYGETEPGYLPRVVQAVIQNNAVLRFPRELQLYVQKMTYNTTYIC